MRHVNTVIRHMVKMISFMAAFLAIKLLNTIIIVKQGITSSSTSTKNYQVFCQSLRIVTVRKLLYIFGILSIVVRIVLLENFLAVLRQVVILRLGAAIEVKEQSVKRT
jgi:hypothetical protein